jgi:hypothetical protein
MSHSHVHVHTILGYGVTDYLPVVDGPPPLQHKSRNLHHAAITHYTCTTWPCPRKLTTGVQLLVWMQSGLRFCTSFLCLDGNAMALHRDVLNISVVWCKKFMVKLHLCKPGRRRRIFRAKKSTACLSSGGIKPSVPCRRFAACNRILRFTWKSKSQAKLTGHFSPNSVLH